MSKKMGFVVLAAIASLGIASANAAPITSLYNTGVNSNGAVLPNGTSNDPHYTITYGNTTVSEIVATSASGWPVGNPWVGDDSLSAWIGPNASQLNGPTGDYVYHTTFTLNGLDPLTALISGRWSTDNLGIGIRLNGINTGVPANVNEFGSWTTFSITTGFTSGLNTLDFIVNNAGGPTGLRVEMTGTASELRASNVPEPGSLALLGLGFLGLAAARKKAKAE